VRNSVHHPRRRRVARIAAVTALALVATLAAAQPGLATGSAKPKPGVETVAGIDPALTAGRGAKVPFVEQEAENATYTGDLIGPDRTPYTLASEASGRKAVKLDAAGEYVQYTLTKAANAVTLRYAIPDAPKGGGLTGPIDVSVNGIKLTSATLTSQYSWLYGTYPFSNDPQADPNKDWWLTECGCVPSATTPAPVFDKPFRPFHFYAETRIPLVVPLKKGDTVRFTVPKTNKLAWIAVDVADFEQVGLPKLPPLKSVNAWLYGADPTGRKSSADALDKAIAAGRKLNVPVYIPPGTYKVDRHLVVDKVTVIGAGNWWTRLTGDGVGVYGKYVEDGGSTNVHLADFSIIGNTRERIDDDQVNGVGGALGGGSTVERLFIQHTKVGMWFDGPFSGLTVKDNIIVDQIADGLNLRRGISNATVTNNFIRGTGDDGLAMWSHGVSTPAQDADHDNVFSHNTVLTPALANNIAIYGGHDNTVSSNVVADPVREGSGLHAGARFTAVPFSGRTTFKDNTTVRASTLDLNWNIGLGAIWLYALEGPVKGIDVVGDHYLDNGYNAIMMVSEWGVKDLYGISDVTFKNVQVDGAGTSVVSARAFGSATFTNVDVRNIGWAGVNNCGSFGFPPTGSEFSLVDGGGNDGTDGNPWEVGRNWFTPFVPNAITCNDRPPVVTPPPPSAW